MAIRPATEVNAIQERIELFYRMLQDCYGIWGWVYDEEMKLLYANSESPYFHGLLLLGRNREEMIRGHGFADDAPLIISNSIGTMWAVVFSKGENGTVDKYCESFRKVKNL